MVLASSLETCTQFGRKGTGTFNLAVKIMLFIWKILDKETSLKVVFSVFITLFELSRQTLGWHLRAGH
jgi:hypothetical protein